MYVAMCRGVEVHTLPSSFYPIVVFAKTTFPRKIQPTVDTVVLETGGYVVYV